MVIVEYLKKNTEWKAIQDLKTTTKEQKANAKFIVKLVHGGISINKHI